MDLSGAETLTEPSETMSGPYELGSSIFGVTFEAQLIGMDPNVFLVDERPEQFELECSNQVQVRRHKKHRINKKWNKRYGPKFRSERVNMGSWTANFDGESCTFTKA